MAPKSERHVQALGGHAVFWTQGNRPMQSIRGLSVAYVVEHLKALYLLSDVVLGAASFYYESAITREATEQLRRLFESGEVAYFIDETLSSFVDHGQQKVDKSPSRFVAYRDKYIVSQRGRVLDRLGHIVRRPQMSISDKIVDRWLAEAKGAPGSDTLGGVAKGGARTETERQAITDSLERIAFDRGGADFVWEYVAPKLAALGISDRARRFVRRRLSELYAEATSDMLGLSAGEASSSSRVSSKSRCDSELFLQTLDVLGVRGALRLMNATAVMSLKRSADFVWFREFYFSLVDSVGAVGAVPVSPAAIRNSIAVYRDAEQRYAFGVVTGKAFVQGFRELCRSAKIRWTDERPLEVLVRAHDLLGRCAIADFVESVRRIVARDRGRSPAVLMTDHYRINAAPRRTKPVLLFLSANPVDTVRLRVDQELRDIDEALRLAQCSEVFELRSAWALRVDDLQDVLLRNNPTLVHFSGHGDEDGCIGLEDSIGRSRSVAPHVLAELFRLLGDRVRVVVLNACFSEPQAVAISKHVDCVVGMGTAIGDATAISFAVALYRALAYGKDIRVAFELAENEVALQGGEDGGSPRLLIRKGVDPTLITWGHRAFGPGSGG